MPELRSDTDVSREIAKGECFDMNNNEKGAKMALSGTRSLLLWCRQQTEGYSEVNVYNMTSSWRDGLGFCAIIHRYRPDLIDFERLSKENILENNELAFSTAEKYLGIPVVLDASDMIENAIPDKLSVITYVSQLCEYFKNKTPANQGFSTKMNILPKTRAESTGHKGSKRSSHQIYTLSGHAKRMATALRNVFRSDTKDDSSKNKELSGSKHVGVDPLRASTETNRNSDELQVLTRPVKKVPFLGTDCFICHSKVFIMERLIVERKLFHRSCFRCEKCNACLRPGTYHYSPETEKFGCLFDCSGGHREKPIKIKFEPLSDPQLCRSPRSSPLNRSPNLSDSNSKKSQQQSKSSLQRQFSVVKRNAITIGALPQKLNQGNLPAVSKSPRQSYSSRTSESLGQKSEGDKKRRFSSSSKSNNKRGSKAKNGQLMEQGGDEKNKSSLSPVSKRRAPDSTLEGAPSEEIDGKDSIKITFTLDETNESSPKVDLVACESGNQPNEEFKEKPFVLKTKEVCRTKADEAHGSGAPSINLSFSFKDELLKRADETRTNESNADNSIIQINLSSCENASREEEQLEGNLAQKNDNDDDVEESKKEQESSRDGVAEGDSETDEPVSMNGSLQDEIEPPIPAKSVQRLREKFLNINDLIDTKHKNNLAKKQSEMDRELRSIAAFKKQRDTSSPKLRKWSANSVEKPKQEISCSRKSVKELRKRYMANGGNENRSKNEKSSSERIRSVSAPAGNRKGSTDGSDGVVSESSSISSQGGRERRATEPESNNNHSLPFEETFGEEASEQNENCDDVGMVTVISVDPNSEESEGSKTSSLLISPENFGRMSHETMTYTIIKSEDVSSDSPLPSFEIHPSSPELPRSKPSSPSHRDLHTSGLKGHAASHDSGIDMPSSTQGTCQTSVPEAVASEQLTTMLDKATTVFCLPTSDESSGFGREQLSSETGSDLQSTDCPWSPSPSSDFSPEVFWSRPLSVGSTASCTETSSSCSSPRMSVIIAQESSTTKINSRFFTVETMEPWEFEDNKFVEERQCVMEIEGEFQFGRERSKTSRAEREAIFSLHRDAKTSSVNSCDLIKEEEITLSPVEIESELQTLETLHAELEKRGVDIEQNLRESMDSERPYNNSEDELLQEWLTVVQERNVVLRRESELIYLLQSQNYEERYRTVEGELRKLVAMRDEVKSSDDVKRERELLSELLELVQKRSFIVDNLEEDRVREIQEDEKIEQAKTEGMTALPGNRWDQRPDCTKVAFSRFYC